MHVVTWQSLELSLKYASGHPPRGRHVCARKVKVLAYLGYEDKSEESLFASLPRVSAEVESR